MTRRVAVITVASAVALSVTACGESEAEKERERGKSAFSAVCDGSPVAGAAGLPSGFPKPRGVTYLKSSKAGPSQIVDGTYDGDLDAAYDAYTDAVKSAGYDILFQEKEEDDAEISYEGGGHTGQIALRDACDDGKLAVHVTNRPQ